VGNVYEIEVSGRNLSIESGRWARQAGGAAVVRYGESVVLVTACVTENPRPGIDFLPLVVDYVEKTFSVGKIPGGFFKREGRLSEFEVLTSRMIDRPIRPLFPKGFYNEIQVIATVLSADKENDTAILAMIGASAALSISDIPFNGPIAGARVGRIDGELVVNPRLPDFDRSDLNIFVAGSRDAILMVEGEANEVPEEEVLDAILFAHRSLAPVLDLQERMTREIGKEKRAFEKQVLAEEDLRKISSIAEGPLAEAYGIRAKQDRHKRIEEISEAVRAAFTDDERAAFLAGLDAVDAHVRAAQGAPFAELPERVRAVAVESLERAGDRRAEPARTWWRLKGLIVHGYFTSERAQQEVLRVNPMPGRFDGAAPHPARAGRS